jgi:DNA sulfur modification protein DndD
LDAEIIPAVLRQTQEGLRSTNILRAELHEIERRLARVPDQDAIAQVVRDRATARDVLATTEGQLISIEQEIDRVDREHASKEATLAAMIQRQVEDDFEQDATWRTITHATKVRNTLERFRSAVVGHHAVRIEQLVLKSFRQLLRKELLITGLRIDPESFALELRGPAGEPLPAERLSAGERQLLAVALLWGLASAAERDLPVVVDTPLGRLDALHRAHLIERYFPKASHQVLLLSTDQEIAGEFLEKLRPFVGRAYRLEYNDQSGSTRIATGYFEPRLN